VLFCVSVCTQTQLLNSLGIMQIPQTICGVHVMHAYAILLAGIGPRCLALSLTATVLHGIAVLAVVSPFSPVVVTTTYGRHMFVVSVACAPVACAQQMLL
jgi:hypothetical protein